MNMEYTNINMEYTNKVYSRALAELLNKIGENGLFSTVKCVDTRFDGFIVVFTDDSDVAIHFGTIGNEEALWESYQMPQDEGDVTGYLTPDDVIERLKTNLS